MFLASSQSSSDPMNALIIDDESDICYLLSTILKQKNISVTFAGSITEADLLLKNGTGPGLIFLDNHLPDGMGMDYISKLKKDFPHSKIIMITAHDTTLDRENARYRGVDSFIGKPFSKETVFKTVDRFRE